MYKTGKGERNGKGFEINHIKFGRIGLTKGATPEVLILIPVFTKVCTIIVMGFSSIGVIKSVLSKKQIRCACPVAVYNLPMLTVTIIENSIMILMAASALILETH